MNAALRLRALPEFWLEEDLSVVGQDREWSAFGVMGGAATLPIHFDGSFL